MIYDKNINVNRLKDMKLILMRTPNEKLGFIKHEWIENIHISWRDKQELTLSIPSIIEENGKLIKNHMYDKFYDKTQLIKCINPNIMFRINSVKTIDEYVLNTKISKKEITAYSLETETMTNLFLDDEELTYCLYKPEGSNNRRNGILNKWLEDNPRWKLGVITNKALYETVEDYIKRYIDIEGFKHSNVQKKDVIWSKDFTISPYSDISYINITIEYLNLKITDNAGGKISEIYNHTTEIKNIHDGVKHITAYYDKKDSEVSNVRYEVTTVDGLVRNYYQPFPYYLGNTVSCDNISLSYTNGEKGEITREKIRSFNGGNYKWIDFLRTDCSESYNVYFDFDGINRTLNVYDIEEYGNNNGGIRLKAGVYYSHTEKDTISENIISKLTINNDNCSIVDINPLGTNYIYNFDHFIQNGHMTNECKNAWERFRKLLSTLKEVILKLRREREELNSRYIKLLNKETALRENIKLLEVRLASIIGKKEAKNEIEELNKQIVNLQNELAQVLKELEEVNRLLEENKNKLNKYKNMLTFENAEDENGKIFNEYTLDEIYSYVCEEKVDDTLFTDDDGVNMYNYYDDLLFKRNLSPVKFSIDLKNFLNIIYIPHGITWDYYIRVGQFLGLKEEKDVLTDKRGVRIIGYDIKPKDKGNEIQNIQLSNNDTKDGSPIIGFTDKLEKLIKRTDRMSYYDKIINKQREEISLLNSLLSNLDINGNILTKNK